MPQISSRDLVRFLEANGFEATRQRGSHLLLLSVERGRSVSVPMHQRADLGRGLAIRILKDAGFTIEEYLEGR